MITLHQGDLLDSGCQIIAHQVNCQGVMGGGIAKTIRERWPEVFQGYAQFCKNGRGKLGEILTLPVRQEEGALPIIVNMFGQDQYGRTRCYTDYAAFGECCVKLHEWIESDPSHKGLRVGMPFNIGCGLAGGDWDTVYSILESVFGDQEIELELWKL